MPSDKIQPFLPAQGKFLSPTDTWRWFENIPLELAGLGLTKEEHSSFAEYYQAAGLLRTWRRPFYRHHYASPLSAAVRELFRRVDSPRILDLGAGSGTQSLLFALLGAEVVAVDGDALALSVLEKRKRFYEEVSERPLRITVCEADVFAINWSSLGPFTGLYSLFAFNMMQPSSKLLEQLGPHLSADAVIAIQDGNPSHFYKRMFARYRRPTLRRDEFGKALRNLGFHDVKHLGAYAIPPPVWCVAPNAILEPLDRQLTKFDSLAVSYLHLARRGK